jgi:hypothetical protein
VGAICRAALHDRSLPTSFHLPEFVREIRVAALLRRERFGDQPQRW